MLNRESVISVLLLAVASTTAAQVQPRSVATATIGAETLAALPHDGKRIFLSTAVFDPTMERPDFSRIAPAAIEDDEYAILQFHSGMMSAREELEKLGVAFFGYLPDNAFQIRASRQMREELKQHPSVRWVGVWEPGFRIDPALRPGSGDPDPFITVVLFPDASLEKIERALRGAFPDAARMAQFDNDRMKTIRFYIPLAQRDAFVSKVATTNGVSWIEPWRELNWHNQSSSGPIQGNVSGDAGRTLFKKGITGTGQIAAVADSGLDVDMCFFRNLNGKNAVTEATRTTGSAIGPLFLDQKIIGYFVQEGADPYDTDAECRGASAAFHGSHVGGTVVGDNFSNASSPGDPGLDNADGMAPNAQLLFQDIGAASGCLEGINDPYEMLLQALLGGARVHNNSYGSTTGGVYTSFDALVDRFLFEHDEMSIFFSAGNSGPGGTTVESPGTSKSAVSVGALGNGNSTTVTRFSSRGPTQDGRVKPDIQAPGSSILSASGNTTFGDGNCGSKTLSGTSMSSPTATGGAALLRQYFADGFYPTGMANAADRLEARAPLVKAVLLNGTLALPVGGSFGDTALGWGRMFLDNNLFFPGDARKLRVWNLQNTQGLSTGQSNSYTVRVGAGQEFRATLVWSDPDATLGAATSLVNNLDLSVANNAGLFLGNVFDSTGNSIPGGNADGRNTVEQVRFTAPVEGDYTITVRASSAPGNGRSGTNRQGYALATSFATCTTGVSAAPSGLVPNNNPIMGVDLVWAGATGASTTMVFRANGSCSSPVGEFQFIGNSNGNTFSDTRAQGGVEYAYRVRGADSCGEGPLSSCVSLSPTGLCDFAPSFRGIATASAGTTDCRIHLTWPAGTSNCPLGQTVRYNVYRSTSPEFVPAGKPHATVVGATQFDDIDVITGTTYYYVVRAEDTVTGAQGPNGGNEETNSGILFATAFGPPGALGTWTDDGGDTNAYLTPEAPWTVTKIDAQSGTRSYRTGFGSAQYPGDTCASVTTPPIKLGPGAELAYFARFNLEFQWDGVVVEISQDGGLTWADLPPAGGYPNTLSQTDNPPINACEYPATKGAFTGPTNNDGLTPWQQYKSSLTAFDGKTVRIRWRFTTDPGAAYEGFFLDTISITNALVPASCTLVPAAPGARFVNSPVFPFNGQTVVFRDQSTHEPTSWSWDFGDGSTSTEQNPTHTYALPGTYTVRLRAANALGTNDVTIQLQVSDPSRIKRKRAL